MRKNYLLLFVFFGIYYSSLQAQNYLRVSDPDGWWTSSVTDPDWHQWLGHGQFDEIRIVVSPQGVYNEVEFYATISQGQADFSWDGDYEITWQFELPEQSIVHDSWLWVEQDIIKADMVDYWTALQTYEEIVDRNKDPSFFYRLPDHRYEMRIYPLFEGESRKIKMSFLVPAEWDIETVKSDLLSNLLQSTDVDLPQIGIGMPVNDTWKSPQLQMGNAIVPITDTVSNGFGLMLHYLEVPGDAFVNHDPQLVFDAPLSNGQRSYVGTYTDGDDHFYQIAYLPDWEKPTWPAARKSLIILDYSDFKSSLSKTELKDHIANILSHHFTALDQLNIAVMTANGIEFLSDNWWAFDEDVLADAILGLLQNQEDSNFEALLTEGFSWVQSQTDVDNVYLLAANDEWVYPPAADMVFDDLESLIPVDIPLTILDYQDENISVVYYDNEEYTGNDYFYQLLTTKNTESNTSVFRDSNEPYAKWLSLLFPGIVSPTGIVDYNTNLENGIAFQRYTLSDHLLSEESNGVFLQVGKFLGDFPLNINASLISDDGQFYSISEVVNPVDVFQGDTLMREMWYGPFLREQEGFVDSEEDRLSIIAQSIEERVLTGLTAFLALEPGLGAEPCVSCLYNSGGVLIYTDEVLDLEDAQLLVTPNPIMQWATIQLSFEGAESSGTWTAGVYDVTGRLVTSLGVPIENGNTLQWDWNVEAGISAGIYFCKAQSEHGEITTKIIVLPN